MPLVIGRSVHNIVSRINYNKIINYVCILINDQQLQATGFTRMFVSGCRNTLILSNVLFSCYKLVYVVLCACADVCVMVALDSNYILVRKLLR